MLNLLENWKRKDWLNNPELQLTEVSYSLFTLLMILEDMENRFIKDGDLKEGGILQSNKISDVDAVGDSLPCISVLGGFFGEFINVISTLENLSKIPEEERAYDDPDYAFL